MTRQQWMLIAAGVLIVLLYVGAVANGGGSGEGSVTAPPGGLVGALGDLFGGAADVPAGDLTGDCLDATGKLTVAGSCVLHVAPGQGDVRNVRLHAEQAVSVTARVPNDTRVATDDVDAGGTTSVAVDGDGGDLTIACRGTDRCQLTVGGR